MAIESRVSDDVRSASTSSHHQSCSLEVKRHVFEVLSNVLGKQWTVLASGGVPESLNSSIPDADQQPHHRSPESVLSDRSRTRRSKSLPPPRLLRIAGGQGRRRSEVELPNPEAARHRLRSGRIRNSQSTSSLSAASYCDGINYMMPLNEHEQ